LTQQDLARGVRMPQSTIARIERGTVIPRSGTLIALLKAAGHQLVAEPIGPPVAEEAIRDRLRMDVPRRTWAALGKRVAADRSKGPFRIVRRLRRFNVPFVLIGELAEVAHGAPMKIKPLIEVCHADTDVAFERIGMALDDLGEAAARILRLTTETAAGDDYEILSRTAVPMHVDAGIMVRVASLDDLIRIRVARGTPEDRVAAAALHAIADSSELGA
jgi:transcriptional regulator with XRE-family HTH domain